jgi:pimeloyl-ACP methyl ester carboxylesterase
MYYLQKNASMKFKTLISITPWILLLYALLINQQTVSGQTEYHTARSADGTEIGFTKVGSGSVPVVFVHGALNSGVQWMAVAETMGEDFTCYVMDRWGRGGSDSHTNYSLNSEAEDIVAVLKIAGPSANLLGHSSGAIYVLEAALKTPPAKLILYEPPLHAFHGRFVEETLSRIQNASAKEQYEDALSIFLTDEVGLSEKQVALLQSTPGSGWDQMVNLTPHSVKEWTELAKQKPTLTRYRDIAIPTLLLTGTETENHVSFATKSLDDILPKSRIVKLNGQGHGANLNAPEMVAKEITSFILETNR